MYIQYRQGTLADLTQIATMIQQAITHMEEHGIYQWDEFYPIIDDFKSDIEKGQLFIGLCDKQIAVIYTLNKECDEAYKNGQWKDEQAAFCVIHRLCVNPAFQNYGVATRTMGHIEETLAAKGIHAIRLDVFLENPFALRLYENFGYRTVGTAHWRKGNFFLMEKYF